MLRWEHYGKDIRVVAQSIGGELYLRPLDGRTLDAGGPREGLNDDGVVSNLSGTLLHRRESNSFARLLSVTTPDCSWATS